MGSSRILIIEDERVIACDLEDILTQAGHEVVGLIDSGEDAAETAEETRPDLALIDIKLRGKVDGIDAARAMRSRLDIAIVYITAYHDDDLFERAKATQPYGYLSKPLSPHDLLRTVEMALYKHEMERRLRKSEERYRRLVETMNDGLAMMDTDGVITYANQRFGEMLGYSIDELIGRPAMTLHDEENRNKLEEQLAKRKRGETTTYELNFLGKQGQEVTAIISARPVFDDDGNLSGSFAVFTDITERKKAERALSESEEQFRAIYENAPVMIDAFAPDGELILWNHEVEKRLGWTEQEAKTFDILARVYPDPKVHREVKRVIALADGKFREFDPVAKDGSRRAQCWANFSLPDGKIICVGYDITESKRLEERVRQSQKMEALGTLAGGIAHDLNNLLQIVLGQADMLLLRNRLDDKSYGSLNAVRKAARDGAGLVQQILTFSRRAESHLTSLNLSDEVQRVFAFLRRAIPRMISTWILQVAVGGD
ncbi:PAS domain S-box protein [Thermodesulfobacteriota bacterium]